MSEPLAFSGITVLVTYDALVLVQHLVVLAQIDQEHQSGDILETMNPLLSLRPSNSLYARWLICRKRRTNRGLISRSSSSTFPRRSVIPSLLPTADASLDTRDAIKGGPNVETEHGTAVGESRGGVVVNDASDFVCLRTMDDSVVSVEWSLCAVWGVST